MARTLAWAATFWLLLFTLTSPVRAQQTEVPASSAAPPLRIGPGDLIEVTMFQNPDMSGRFRVDEGGDIILPLIGHVHVEGATAEEAAELIQKRYVDAQILLPAKAHATVFIAEYATQGITVNGEVKNPGVYPALGIRMLNDVITAAGGVTPLASSKILIMHKSDPGSPTKVDYNPSALTPIIPLVQIFPGDTVVVPRAGMVYVLGDVIKSGVFVLDGRSTLTVEEVMALAGGSARAAALKRVQLVRTLEDGRKEQIILPVNRIFKGQSPDVALIDGDILFVPTSNGKLITEQAINSALSIGTSFAVYRTSVQQ